MNEQRIAFEGLELYLRQFKSSDELVKFQRNARVTTTQKVGEALSQEEGEKNNRA